MSTKEPCEVCSIDDGCTCAGCGRALRTVPAAEMQYLRAVEKAVRDALNMEVPALYVLSELVRHHNSAGRRLLRGRFGAPYPAKEAA